MSAALALQAAIGARLAADPAVLALVPAGQIIDSHSLPEAFPCVILGEDQEVADDLTFERQHVRVTSTLHVWHREAGLAGVKAIAGAIRDALRGGLPVLSGASCLDMRFEGARFMRDPDGITSHGVVTVDSLVELPL